MCNGVPNNNMNIFAEIFYREAFFKSLSEYNPTPILWKNVLNFVQRHIEPDGLTKDEYGHTPAGSKADILVKIGLIRKWIVKKSRGHYMIDPAKVNEDLVLKVEPELVLE
jgi:hypothetical protein